MSQKEVRKRNTYLDSVAGIMIIHMIIGHCCQWAKVWDEYYKISYLLFFFMPWFFFKAGMFFSKKPFKEELNKSYKRLIKPFIVFSIIGTIVYYFTIIIHGELSIRTLVGPFRVLLCYGATHGNPALWFLLSLFVVRLVFNCIMHIETKTNALTMLLMGGGVAFVSVVWLLSYYANTGFGLKIPYYIPNISSGFAFFSLGYLLRDVKFTNITTLLILTTYIFFAYLFPVSVDMRSNSFDSSPWFWIPLSLLGILAINSVAKIFVNNYNLFAYIGENSMSYYCLHWIIILLVSNFFYDCSSASYVFLLYLLLANIIILPIATKLIKTSKFRNIIG